MVPGAATRSERQGVAGSALAKRNAIAAKGGRGGQGSKNELIGSNKMNAGALCGTPAHMAKVCASTLYGASFITGCFGTPARMAVMRARHSRPHAWQVE